jgi:hypothetical protein
MEGDFLISALCFFGGLPFDEDEEIPNTESSKGSRK